MPAVAPHLGVNGCDRVHPRPDHIGVRVLPLQPAVPARAAAVAAPPAAPPGAALAASAAAPPAQPQPPAQPAAITCAAATAADPAMRTAAATGCQRQRLHGKPHWPVSAFCALHAGSLPHHRALL